MNKTNLAKMEERASKHGQCVRQLTVRQQTTQFSAGTLPMYCQPMGYKPTTRLGLSTVMWKKKSLKEKKQIEGRNEGRSYELSKLGRQHTKAPLAAALSPFMSLLYPPNTRCD